MHKRKKDTIKLQSVQNSPKLTHFRSSGDLRGVILHTMQKQDRTGLAERCAYRQGTKYFPLYMHKRRKDTIKLRNHVKSLQKADKSPFQASRTSFFAHYAS